MNDGIRKSSFGEILSGSGGGCAVASVAVVVGGMTIAFREQPFSWVMAGFVALLFLAIGARRLEIRYDISRGKVTVVRRFWPLRGSPVLELDRAEIKNFLILEEKYDDNDTSHRYAFELVDGRHVYASHTGSNALGYDVVAEVRNMLGL